MALAVAFTGGNVTTAGDTIISNSWTSTSGSLIVAICHGFNTVGTPGNGDVTDSKGNGYLLATHNLAAAAVGTGVWYTYSGSRGTSHTVTYNAAGASGSVNISVIEITGHEVAGPLDSTTAALASDATSTYDVTAAAVINGNQIAIYGVTLDISNTAGWTDPSGYTNIINQTNGANLISYAGYKLNETGTPTVGAARAGVAAAGKEILVTFKQGRGYHFNNAGLKPHPFSPGNAR